MEQLSRAYVTAVAAACGCRWSVPTPDYVTDLSLRQVVFRNKKWVEVGPALDIQLRSTTAAALAADHVAYDLDAGTYDKLRRATLTVPAVLVLLVLPPARDDWLNHTEDRLELRGCAYWLSLCGEPATPNKSSVGVRIPRANQFTPAALERIMEAVRRRRSV